MLIAISILNYNGNEETEALLDSLDELALSGNNLMVIVLDNHSKVPFQKTKDYKNFSLDVLQEATNLGFSGGHNKSMQLALEKGAEYIMVLNNDTIVDKNLLSMLLRAAVSHKSAGIIAPKIYFAKGQEYHKDRYSVSDLGHVLWYAGGNMDWKNIIATHRGVDEVDHGQYNKTEETEFATGCCLLLPSTVIKTVGMFDERYFLYYEDLDLNQRIKHAGYHIIYEPNAFLWHANAKSSGGSGSNLQDYYISRNRLLFGFSYAATRAKFALFRESLRLFLSGRPMQKNGVRDFYLRKFGKGSYE